MDENIINNNTDKIKLSVIVPIYNVEHYIRKCAESLLAQTCSPDLYEVIFVNDGTKDRSVDVLKNCVDFENLKNFHLLEKPNGGLSSARNYGIKNSVGQYFWCIDSDDWIETDSIKCLLDLLKDNPDAIYTSTLFFNKTDSESVSDTDISINTGSGKQLMGLHPAFMAAVYIIRRTFWNENHFDFYEGILHEDYELMPRVVYSAISMRICHKPLYHYLQREGSITQIKNPKRVYDMMKIINSYSLFLNSKVHHNDIKLVCTCLSDIVLALFEASQNMDKDVLADVNIFCNKNRKLAYILRNSRKLQSVLFGWFMFLPIKPTNVYSFLHKLKNIIR
ncbi:glycosyltransferase family A protein [uncultured Prevotella sp.]|uniref:glycosyltransferase family 2 protein n=1 Tax=uncultured Prevotella sp. TaxID=159272 RepID=UPI00266B4DD3|nr:glycosyltransferase family A protein [uncultured Prevotella sp.]